MDLGPHAAYIWSSYGIVGIVLAALMAWLIADGRRNQRRLTELDAKGVRRRSSG